MEKKLLIFLLALFAFSSYSQTTRNIEVSITSTKKIKGEYRIWFKRNAAPAPDVLTKPFIIVEGFDPSNSMGLDEIYDQIDRPTLGINLLNFLRCQGYDIVVLNLFNNSEPIEYNAQLLRKLINDVNAEVRANSANFRPYLLGISMGGLICRYALAQMETSGVDHKVESFISFDTPNQGANVPLGYQHMLNFWLHPNTITHELTTLIPAAINPAKKINEIATERFKVGFLSPAALQMAATYVSNVNPIHNTNRASFLTKLDQAGSYPTKCRKVAIANGTNGVAQQGLASGDLMFAWEHKLCVIDRDFDLPYKLGKTRVTYCPFILSQKAWAMPGNAFGAVCNTEFGGQKGINNTRISTGNLPFFANQRDVTTGPANANMDHVPGGRYELEMLTDLQESLEGEDNIKIPIDWDEEICIKVPVFKWSGIKFEKRCEDVAIIHTEINIPKKDAYGRIWGRGFNFCFVPTIGALDIKTSNYFYDITSIPSYPYPKNKSFTPFDAVFFNVENDAQNNPVNVNSDHAFLSGAPMAQFIRGEVSPNDLFIQNRIFPSGYENTFEALNSITMGSNVDIVNNRSLVGPVKMSAGNNIRLIVGENGSVTLAPGFETGGGELSIATRPYPQCANGAGFNQRIIAPLNTQQPTTYPPYNGATSYTIDSTFYDPFAVTPRTPTASTSTGSNFRIGIPENEEENVHYSKLSSTASPNPFSSSTSISFKVEKENIVSLIVYNEKGKEIVKIVEDQMLGEGDYKFDLSGSKLPNGIYLYKLIVGDNEETKKIILVK